MELLIVKPQKMLKGLLLPSPLNSWLQTAALVALPSPRLRFEAEALSTHALLPGLLVAPLPYIKLYHARQRVIPPCRQWTSAMKSAHGH